MAIGILIGLGFPLTYYHLETREVQRTAANHAMNIAMRFPDLIVASPMLWKYQTGQHLVILAEYRTVYAGTIVRVYDDGGRLLSSVGELEDARGQPQRRSVAGIAPITYNGRTVGSVEVTLSLAPVLKVSVVVLLVSAVGGAVLASVAHVYPVRVVRRMETHIARFVDDVRQARVESDRLRAIAEQAKRATQALNDELEARVAARTAELEAASAAKSEFLSRVSHELRTPLHSILGFGQLLALQELPVRQRQGVEQILRGGRHLLDLINEVLDIARIESGRMTLSVEPVAVGEVVGEIVDLLGPQAGERGIQMEATALAGCVMADRQRLKQVLLNLLSNAVKYNRDGGRVAVWMEAGGVGRRRIVVEDSGPGMSAVRVGRLFRPFERLGAEQTEVEGTGLGLALSKGLVETMGGQLGVASEEGVGSRFWVELAEATQLTAEERAEAGPVKAGVVAVAAAATPAAVLYIEDNPANLQVVEWALEGRPGLELVTAMQGRLGVELARRYQPKLILLDLHLPDMAGQEVLDVLRMDGRTRDVPIVVLSADATAAQVARLKDAGVREYLTKPLDIVKLQALVDAVVAEPVPTHV
jgi:signal transduction histidine kinase/CheY-like chemotaxis protein